MVIEEKDFRLTPIKDSGSIFDLELLKTVNKGKDNERQEFKVIAYGVSFEGAMKFIANHRIAEKYPETIDLKTYLQEYRSIIDEIKKLLCED